ARREGFTLGGRTGQGVVVAVRAGTGVGEDPTEGRTVRGGREGALVEGGHEVVTGNLLDALGLPLPVDGAEGVSDVAVAAAVARGDRTGDPLSQAGHELVAQVVGPRPGRNAVLAGRAEQLGT